jgi:hypothetical protein
MITGMTKHFMFHIRWISILKFLYFNFFFDSFHIAFLSDGIATSISKQILSFLFLIIMSGLFARTSLISLYPLIPQYCYIFMLTYRLRYVELPVFCCFNA